MSDPGEYVERGWSSEHTATGFARQPMPRIYELDVVRCRDGWSGTVVHRDGAWLTIEGAVPGDIWYALADTVELVWTR